MNLTKISRRLFPIKQKGGIKPLLLTDGGSSNKNQELEQETLLARQILNVVVRPGKDGNAIVKSLNNYNDCSVAYHHSASFINGSPLELHRAFQHSPEITVLVRAVTQNPDTFIKHLQNEIATSNKTKTTFLEDVNEWALPRKAGRIFGHDLLIWGPSSVIIPKAREETAALYGSIIKYYEIGSVIRSVIYALPMNRSETYRDLLSGSVDGIRWAAPRKIIWHPRFYILPDINMAFSFWSGIVNLENIERLLELGDLLLRAENIERRLYCTALLRVSAPVTNGKPDFSATALQLVKLGKWEQISGMDVRTAFKSFVPGSSPSPPWYRHSVAKPGPVLNKITQPLKTVGDSYGTNMMGVIDGQPLLLDPWLRPGRVYEGPSKTGKSTLAAAHAAQVTNNIIWFPLTAGEFEAAPYWVKELGGRVIELNLPDSYTLLHERNRSQITFEQSDYIKKQEKLHSTDRADAEAVVKDLVNSWKNRGKIVGLPLTFHIKSGETVRLFNWYIQFLNAWREDWRLWYEKTGEKALVVADNFSALQLAENDTFLGNMPNKIGKDLGVSFSWLVSNGRNIGNACWILTHTIQDLDYISSGLYNQFGLHISLSHNDYTLAKVIQPKEREILATELNIRLPQPIKALFERREPKFFEEAVDGQPSDQKSV